MVRTGKQYPLEDEDGHLPEGAGQELLELGFDELGIEEESEEIYYDTNDWPWDAKDWSKYIR